MNIYIKNTALGVVTLFLITIYAFYGYLEYIDWIEDKEMSRQASEWVEAAETCDDYGCQEFHKIEKINSTGLIIVITEDNEYRELKNE